MLSKKVITIPRGQSVQKGLVPSKNVRPVGYIRSSTDLQEVSPRAQQEAIEECGKRNGWLVDCFYVDDSVSSWIAPHDRPRMRELFNDAKEGVFDLVLVTSFDRLAREIEDSAKIRKELWALGINVAEISNPFLNANTKQGKLLYGIKSIVSENERDEIAERTSRGMRQLSKEGFNVGRPRVGFDSIPVDPKAKKTHYRLVLNDLGKRGLEIYNMNRKIKAKKFAQDLGFACTGPEYFKARYLLRNLREYIEGLESQTKA